MTPISSTAGAGAAASGGETVATKLNADYQMFLKLLTTQLQNQDPLEPMDSAQYTQQLVQFSQVEQSIEQTSTLKTILARLSTGDVAGASALIGRDVQFESTTSGLSADSPARWAWSVDSRADTVTAEIRNGLGRKVATVQLDPSSTSGQVGWTGELPDGTTAADGAYTLSIVARGTDGSNIPATVNSVGRVQDVVVENGTTLLGVNGINLPFTSLKRVSGGAFPG